MGDYIKREDAIEAIASADETNGTVKVFTGREVNGILSEIPTADVRENVKGEWIDAQYPFSKCNICDCYFDTANNEANFCPNCGADMRGKT